eukprot:335166-Prorocentrum_minimum.AAC.1
MSDRPLAAAGAPDSPTRAAALRSECWTCFRQRGAGGGAGRGTTRALVAPSCASRRWPGSRRTVSSTRRKRTGASPPARSPPGWRCGPIRDIYGVYTGHIPPGTTNREQGWTFGAEEGLTVGVLKQTNAERESQISGLTKPMSPPPLLPLCKTDVASALLPLCKTEPLCYRCAVQLLPQVWSPRPLTLIDIGCNK